jgi:cell division topological specificity factor
MFDFFNKLFNPSPPSGATAKERLRLVLLSDHLALAPDVIDALKRDLLAVISRYVEIDGAHADVTFEHREGEVAMLASIPITGVRERGRPEPSLPTAPPELARAESGAGDTRSQAAEMVANAASFTPATGLAATATAYGLPAGAAAADVAANAPEAGVSARGPASGVTADASVGDDVVPATGALAAGAGDPAAAMASTARPNSPAPRRRRRRKSAAAKRAAQQAIAFGTPAQA